MDSPRPARKAPPKRSGRVEPLAPARYKVTFTASAEFRDKLSRLQALMHSADLAAVLEAAVSDKLESLEARRYGKTNAARKTADDCDTLAGSRYIVAPVRRVVCERDEDQCTFVSDNGERCPETDNLEFHHDAPHARGGDRSPENIRLVCKAHNAWLADQDYGKDYMDQRRSAASRAREPALVYSAAPIAHSVQTELHELT